MGVDDTQVTLGNGLDEVIHIMLQTFGPGRRVIAQKPSFVMYEVAALAAGAGYRGVALGEALKLSVTEIIEEANSEAEAGLGAGPPVVILCNPHNPTGGRLSEAEIEAVLRATQALVVVDEAYIEFAGGSVLPLLAKYDRLVVLRTMSKAFGLAGVRVGYSVSSPGVAAELAKVRQPFNLDSLALVIAQTALQNDAYCQEAIARIVEERARLARRLSCIPGITCLPSCTNFILFRTESAEAAEVHGALRRCGVAVRVFPGEPMLRQHPQSLRNSRGGRHISGGSGKRHARPALGWNVPLLRR